MHQIYKDLLQNVDGFGKMTVENIKDTLSVQEFKLGCRIAYYNNDTSLLEMVPGIGSSKAFRLAEWYANRSDLSISKPPDRRVYVVHSKDLIS